MSKFPSNIVCAYLHVITKYGYPPPAGDTNRHLEEMDDLGFQSVELEGIRKEHLSEVYSIRHSILQEVDRRRLSVPFFCIVLPGLSSPDRQTREHNLELFEMGCEIAQLLRAKGVIDNGPLPPYQFSDDIPVVRHYDEIILNNVTFPAKLEWSAYWKDLISTYQQVCDIASRYDLSFHLHPALGVIGSTVGDFLYFARAVNRKNFRFNFDTANLFALRENLSLSQIRSAAFTDYIHVSDNGGEQMEHLAMGEGRIDWDSFFQTLDRIGFQGYFGIDIGGEESNVSDLDHAYRDTALMLSRYITKDL